MQKLASRLLVLACSLLLALPQGWCCYAFARAAVQGERVQSVKARPCCAEQKSRSSAPGEAPAPAKPGKCPCADRNSTAPEKPLTISLDSSLPVVLALADTAPDLHDGSRFDFGREVLHPSGAPSLRLLHCLWLC